MSYGNIPKTALEKLDPLLCGTDYRTDAPYCKQETRTDINLNEYDEQKYKTYFYRTPIQVQFCEDFTKKYNNSENEPGASCAKTLEDAQKLESLVAGRRKEIEAKRATMKAVPTEEARYRTLMSGLPLSSQRRRDVQESMRAQARADVAEKAAEESAKSKEIADLEQQLDKAEATSEKACQGVAPKVLKQIADDCKSILDDNQKAIATRDGWVGKFLVGLGTAFFFIVQGRLRRSLEAGGRAWGDSKQAQEPLYTRILKTIEAVWKGSQPDAAETPTDEGTSPADDTGTGNPEDVPGEVKPTDETLPNETPAPNAAEAAEKTASNVNFLPEFDPNHLANQTHEALTMIARTGEEEFGRDHSAVRAVRSAVEMSEENGQARFFRLITVMRSPATLDLIEAIAKQREHRFFDDFLPGTSQALTKAAELMAHNRINEGKALLEMISAKLPDIDRMTRDSSIILNRVATIEKSARKMLKLPDDGAIQKIDGTIGALRSINHDIANVTAGIGGVINERDNPKLFAEFVRRSNQFNIGDANALMRSVAGLVTRKSIERGVKMEVIGLSHTVRIPHEKQRALFRSLFTFVDNGVNYSDDKKKVDRYVKIEARQEGSELVFTVKDNGIGMTREQVELIHKESGHRFEPKHAPGSGVGLNGAIHIAIENGFQLGFKPEPGQGMEVTLRVDTSAWGKNGSSNGNSGNGSGTKMAKDKTSFSSVEVVSDGEQPQAANNEKLSMLVTTDERGNPVSVDPTIGAPSFVEHSAATFVEHSAATFFGTLASPAKP